jgi:hypothetical protein
VQSEWPSSLQSVELSQFQPTHFHPEDGGSIFFWNSGISEHGVTNQKTAIKCGIDFCWIWGSHGSDYEHFLLRHYSI